MVEMCQFSFKCTIWTEMLNKYWI